MTFFKIHPKLIFNIILKRPYFFKSTICYFNLRKFIYPLYYFRFAFLYNTGKNYISKNSNKYMSGRACGLFGLSVKNLIYIKKIKKKKKKKKIEFFINKHNKYNRLKKWTKYKIWCTRLKQYYFFFFWFFFKKLHFCPSLRLFCKLPPYGKRTRTNHKIFHKLHKQLLFFQHKYFKTFNLKKHKVMKYYKNVWI